MEEATITPTKALVLYTKGYCEMHSIYQSNNSEYILGPGAPVTKDFLLSLKPYTENVKILETRAEVFPPNLLFLDNKPQGRRIVWFVKPDIRSILFTESTKIDSCTCRTVPLVFDYRYNHLYIYAIKNNSCAENIEEKLLFQAPFFNTQEDGSVCMGTAEVDTEDLTIKEAINQIETAFFSSYFSHKSGAKAKVSLERYWKSSAIAREMLEGWLVSSSYKTLLELIENE